MRAEKRRNDAYRASGGRASWNVEDYYNEATMTQPDWKGLAAQYAKWLRRHGICTYCGGSRLGCEARWWEQRKCCPDCEHGNREARLLAILDEKDDRDPA